MKAEIDSDNICSIIDSFGTYNITDEAIEIMKKGDISQLNNEFDFFNFDDSSVSQIKNLQSILASWLPYTDSSKAHKKDSITDEINCPNESDLWIVLSERETYPYHFEAICFALASKDGALFNQCAILYCTLLCFQTYATIWCPPIFHTILSILISASQILENGGSLSQETLDLFSLTSSILPLLSQAFTKELSNTVGVDVFFAVCELASKLCNAPHSEFEKQSRQINNEASHLFSNLLKADIKHSLPHLVNGLLLHWASSSTAINSRIQAASDRFVELLWNVDLEYLSNLVKHLIIRAPEKAHLKRLVANTILSTIKRDPEPQKLIDFILLCTNSSKTSQRSFAALLIGKIIPDIDEIIRNDADCTTCITLTASLKKLCSDCAPTVRAAALDGLSLYIQRHEQLQPAESDFIPQVYIQSSSLDKLLKKRLVDEKLIVRRAALGLAQAKLDCDKEPSFELLSLIAERTRDRSVAIRLSASKMITSIQKKNKDDKITELFLDSILPLIMDTDTNVQSEALDSLNDVIFSKFIAIRDHRTEIDQEYLNHLNRILNSEHYQFIETAIKVQMQRSIPLTKLCRGVQILIEFGDKTMLTWKLAKFLSEVTPQHFSPEKFEDLWDQQTELPPEFFSVLINLHANIESNSIAKAIKIELSSFNPNFASISNLIKLFEENENHISSLMKQCCEQVNSVVCNENSNSLTISALSNYVFAIGECFKYVNPLDYNFTGMNILLNLELPNGTKVDPIVQAASVLSLGKLCLTNKNLTKEYAPVFAQILTHDFPPPVKCNALLVLCDLCIAFSASVDSYLPLLSTCFVDENSHVRHQALLITTRLVAEDYLKMSSLLFFRFTRALSDKETGDFAGRCLFDVLCAKEPNLLKSNFLDTLYYFFSDFDNGLNEETQEEHELFSLSKEEATTVIDIIIDKMSPIEVFSLIDEVFRKIVQRILNLELRLKDNERVLEQALCSLIKLESRLKGTTEIEANTDDPNTQKTLDDGKKLISNIHNRMIEEIMPILNELHKKLREENSSLQGVCRNFYKCLCENNPGLIETIERTNPILFVEIEAEMKGEHEKTNEENITQTEKHFTSPLLAKIASTPRKELCSPSPFKNKKDGKLNSPPPNKQQNIFSTPTRDNDSDDLFL